MYEYLLMCDPDLCPGFPPPQTNLGTNLHVGPWSQSFTKTAHVILTISYTPED